MFRIQATMNHLKCASSLISQGSRTAYRPMSTSAPRFSEEAFKSQEHDVDALFNAESSTEPRKRSPRGSACINRIELLGGVADYPVERSGRTGNKYLSFNMFTNVEYRKPDGSVDENVELHNVTVFGNNLGYVRRNVQKGSRVFVTGRLHYTNGRQIGGGSQPGFGATIASDLVQVIAKPAPRERDESFDQGAHGNQ